jgi:uncharacterized membrane protein
MTMPSLVWGSPGWTGGALAVLFAAALLILLSYRGASTARLGVRICAAALKALAFTALAVSLLEPLLAGVRPRKGANVFVVLADNSQSLLIRGEQGAPSRGEWMQNLLRGESAWKTRLGQDFDVRKYAFDTHLRAVDGFDALTFDGTGTALGTSLAALSRRFKGLPLAGVLLFSDGNRTDTGDIDWSSLPPIYPVVPPSGTSARDVAVNQVSTSQTNFETAPVVIQADLRARGFKGESIVAVLEDDSGKELERQELSATSDDKPLGFRFQFRPAHKGVSFYRVRAVPAKEQAKTGSGALAKPASSEQTLANNSRLAVIDQGSGPYRVLYVAGRPDWEFKFLRRAAEEDDQIALVGLVRIARRQPKFDFQASGSRSTSPLFTGFDHPDPDTAERADQPVLIRLGRALDGVELRDGFPKGVDELYRYHAIVIDDLEAAFFSPDQLALLRNFVSVRGGGLLMLGGPDSFAEGKYDRTPVGELLPVYLNRASSEPTDASEYRLVLTREGWLQPWVRLRKTEDEENKRLAAMVPFETVSRVGNIKPGAIVLAEVSDGSDSRFPALVAQQFGRGHVAALLIGGLWRWQMARKNLNETDFDRAWRQTIRWLVGDVPDRVEVSVRPQAGSSAPAVEITARLRDAEYHPLDNGKVSLRVVRPSGDDLRLDAGPDPREPGSYSATYVPKQPGPYRFVATATAPDGSAIGERETGWAAQPAADEFARLEPDQAFLNSIAKQTHGELVDAADLGSFVCGLASRDAPITEPWTSPLWHHPVYFLIAITCILAEWGLRRINGLA